MTTALYSCMHFLVDFLCAWAMFHAFQTGPQAYLNFLIYNFCAFALQMPLGTLLDLQRDKAAGKQPLLWAGAGALLTGIGALTHPAVLGLGNALFHVGGGLDVIAGDMANNRQGRDLGIFVAPGAIGLYFGTRLGKTGSGLLTLAVSMCLLAALFFLLLRGHRNRTFAYAPERTAPGRKSLTVLLLCCFAVVVLRSWTGFAAGFSWKSQTALSFVAVLAVALGKAAGGFASARFGAGRTVTVSLLLAAGCYLLGDSPVFGLAAMLLFNMSMPVTLYLLARHLPKLPGFAFGLLTFGLFLGFLPVYLGVELPLSGSTMGALGSVLSAVLMGFAWKAVGKVELPA